MTKIRKAIFPIADQSDRFLPATKAVPKEMLPLVDRPLIDYAIEEARDAGIEEFIFVTAPGKEAIERHVAPAADLERTLAAKGREDLLSAVRRSTLPAGSVRIVHQERPLGLAHAVWCAREIVGDEPFAVLLPDDVIKSRHSCLRQVLLAQSMAGGNMIAAVDVGPAISSYDCFAVGATTGRLSLAKGIVGKPEPDAAPSALAAIGRYVLQPEVMAALDSALVGAGREIQLNDAITAVMGDVPLWAFEFEGEWFDCGSQLGFMQATMAYGLDHPDLGGPFAALASYRMAIARAA